jgi:anti-anti-sigma factor
VIHTGGPAPDAEGFAVRSSADGSAGAAGHSSASFQVEEEDGGDLVIWLRGEFDITSVGPLEATVLDLVVGAPSRLVFDLGDLQFMDPCGLAVLVTAARAVPVGLRRVPPLLRRMIELTGLASMLPEER